MSIEWPDLSAGLTDSTAYKAEQMGSDAEVGRWKTIKRNGERATRIGSILVKLQ